MPSSVANKTRSGDWIDGLRGISAFVVVTYHIHESWNQNAMHPYPGNGYDIPWLRIPVSGAAAVAIFFILTGYVNTLAFFRKTRSGDSTGAMAALSKSALTRVGKFVPPVLLATTLDWLMAEAHAFELGTHTDSGWIAGSSVMPEKNPLTSLHHLYASFLGLWTGGWVEFDKTLWPILSLLQASLDAYLFLLATSGCSKKARRIVLAMLYLWSWASDQSVKGINLWFGVFMADLSASYMSKPATTKNATLWSIPIILVGGTLCCIPDAAWDQATWCMIVDKIFEAVKPHSGDTRRFVVSVGGCAVIFGCFYNKYAQKILCWKVFVFFGKISLPMYLLHSALLRSVLTWIVYLPSVLDSEEEGHRYKQWVGGEDGEEEVFYKRGGWQFFLIGVPIFYTILISLAHVWTQWVDPTCAEVVDWLAKKAYEQPDEQSVEGQIRIVEDEENMLPASIPMEPMTETQPQMREVTTSGEASLPLPHEFLLEEEEGHEKVALLPAPVQATPFRD